MITTMKKILLFAVAISISTVCFAQDILVHKDGKRAEVIITEITPKLVRFKLFSDPKGKVYFALMDNVSGIVYRNGTIETFEKSEKREVEYVTENRNQQSNVYVVKQENVEIPDQSISKQSKTNNLIQPKNETRKEEVPTNRKNTIQQNDYQKPPKIKNLNSSQRKSSILGVSPIRLWSGLRLKYERPINDKITYGGILTGYYGSYPGIQLAPIGRFYFKAKAPEGFYAQAKIVGGYFQANYTSKYGDKKQSFTNFGGGIALGYQLLWGKDNKWTIDINLGVKVVGNVPQPPDNDDTFGIGNAFSNAGWYTLGPGSIVDGLISIGYRF